MRKLVILGLQLLFTVRAFVQTPPTEAVERLEVVKFFSIGGVGFAGTISPGEKDFRMVKALAPEEALKEFEEVYAKGNLQGKSYALVAIHQLAPERFDELRQSLGSESGKVEVMTGCIADRELFTQVVKEIENGKFGGSRKQR